MIVHASHKLFIKAVYIVSAENCGRPLQQLLTNFCCKIILAIGGAFQLRRCDTCYKHCPGVWNNVWHATRSDFKLIKNLKVFIRQDRCKLKYLAKHFVEARCFSVIENKTIQNISPLLEELLHYLKLINFCFCDSLGLPKPFKSCFNFEIINRAGYTCKNLQL